MIVAILKQKRKKEKPKLAGHRFFKVDTTRLRRIARKERDPQGRMNESHSLRVAIKEKYDRMFTQQKE